MSGRDKETKRRRDEVVADGHTWIFALRLFVSLSLRLFSEKETPGSEDPGVSQF